MSAVARAFRTRVAVDIGPGDDVARCNHSAAFKARVVLEAIGDSGLKISDWLRLGLAKLVKGFPHRIRNERLPTIASQPNPGIAKNSITDVRVRTALVGR